MYRKGQPKNLKNLVSEKTIRLNAIGDTAWKQVAQFFAQCTRQPVSNSVLVSVAVEFYRNHIIASLRPAIDLKNEGLEQEHIDLLSTIAREELARVYKIRQG
jgi:hypothetical protein